MVVTKFYFCHFYKKKIIFIICAIYFIIFWLIKFKKML